MGDFSKFMISRVHNEVVFCLQYIQIPEWCFNIKYSLKVETSK